MKPSPRQPRPKTPSRNVAAPVDLLEAIPEANLLQPDVMLTLSKHFFMNRSPALPSPWPHWSECTSGFAQEPAIYCSAFKDFHSLVVSVTRRLVQTAIMQATSRLRSQRRRLKKGILPLVRRRDVLTAIDVVGMKRNGRERWRGVARRCALQVFEGRKDYTQIGKYRREMPWEKVERVLASSEFSEAPFTSDGETSGDAAEDFGYTATRGRTHLPMERLALSDSDEQPDTVSSNRGRVTASQMQSPQRALSQPRDQRGRYASAPPMTNTEASKVHLSTINHFDMEASQHEQRVLWKMLDLEPPPMDEKTKVMEDEEDDPEIDEMIITEANDWRSWTAYKAAWEVFDVPLLADDFERDEKANRNVPIGNKVSLQGRGIGSDASGNEMGGEGPTKTKFMASESSELRVRGTREYAALQEMATMADDAEMFDSSAPSGDASEARLSESTEDSTHSSSTRDSEEEGDDEMDWEA